MTITDTIALAIGDALSNIADQFGDIAELRAAESGARAVVRAAQWEAFRHGRRLKAVDTLIPPALTRYKAAPGMQSIELPASLAQALTQARAQLGDDQLARLLAGSAPKGTTSLSDADGATTGPTHKTTQRAANVFDHLSAKLQRQPNVNDW